jgi:hypothetical protein
VCAIGVNTLGSSQKIAQMEQLMTGFMEQNAQVGATVSETDGAGGKLTIYDVSGGTQEDTGSVSAQERLETTVEETAAGGTLTGTEESITDAAGTSGETGEEQAGVQPEETDGEQAGVQPEETGEEAGVQPEEPGEEQAGAQLEETGEEQAGVQPEETGEELAGVLPEESKEELGVDTVSALPEGCILYTVQPGDTLSSICVGLYGSHEQMENICALNGLEDPNLISEGQNLIVPAYELSQEQENAGEELVQEPVE